MEKKKSGLTPEELQNQIIKRSTPRDSLGTMYEEKVPRFARGVAHKLFDRLDLYRPPIGFDQDIIPKGIQPEVAFDRKVTRGIAGLAHPHIVERQKDRDIVLETKEHLAHRGTLVVVSNHLSHVDGPEVTKVLEDQGIPGVVSVLGLRIIRNPVANQIRQGVPSIPVYPASEYFWDGEAFAQIKDQLSEEQLAYVHREQVLAREMNLAASQAIRDAHEAKHPILVFLEGSRHPKEGLQEPVASTSGVIKRGGSDVKVLVMSLMGTENVMPKLESDRSGKKEKTLKNKINPKKWIEAYPGPKIAKVTARFVDLLDTNAMMQAYQEDHPQAKFDEINAYVLDQIMITIAKGVDPQYRGIYADRVENEYEFIPQENPKASPRESIKKLMQRVPHRQVF